MNLKQYPKISFCMKQFTPILIASILTASLLNLESSIVYAKANDCVFSIGKSSTKCKHRPVSRFAVNGIRVEAPALLTQSVWTASPLDLGDSVFTDQQSGRLSYNPRNAYNTQARLGLTVDTLDKFSALINLKLHYEQDFISGFFRGGESDVAALALPMSQNPEYNAIRKAYVRLMLSPFLIVSAGRMTSHWGLGLLANDGAHGWTPKSTYFGDPRGGDRVNRLQLSSVISTRSMTVLSVAFDKVDSDDILQNDDEAQQVVVAAVYGRNKKRELGAYMVIRDQDSPQTIDGYKRDKKTQVRVFDVYAKDSWRLRPGLNLHAELESVFIKGTTTLAPSPESPKSDVLQFALASKVKLQGKNTGAVLDFVYATGDQNFDDGSQNAFKADPNYELGLLLFRHVMAAHTGRGPITASDPNLVGKPNEDLDRFPTRGSVSNTIAVFPKAWYRLYSGLEVYGGPLMAWGEVPLADPRNTRFNGGYPINVLGGQGGRYLGTEIDLGLRFLVNLSKVTQLTLGFEGAYFMPGNAFESDPKLDDIYGGRFIAQARF